MAYKTTELVSLYKKSGLSQRQYCDKNEIALSTLYYHVKKLEKQSRQPVGRFLPLSVKRANDDDNNKSKTKTVLLLHGEISVSEIAELIKGLS